jgi:hypothetical protein
MERMREIIKNENYKIIFTWSFSEFFINHIDIHYYINEYFNNNLNNYSFVYYFNDQPFSTNIFLNNIKFI